MSRNPYHTLHKKEELSVEINFRSFLFGEGAEFFEPVPVVDLVNYATLGSPVTIPEGDVYSEEDLIQIAQAAQKGGGTVTLVSTSSYPDGVVARLQSVAPGLIRTV